jgi:hypothetical protein
MKYNQFSSLRLRISPDQSLQRSSSANHSMPLALLQGRISLICKISRDLRFLQCSDRIHRVGKLLESGQSLFELLGYLAHMSNAIGQPLPTFDIVHRL